MSVETLLRVRSGEYVTRDGRFYADRIAGGRWRALDGFGPKAVEQVYDTLRQCRVWFSRRRKVRP